MTSLSELIPPSDSDAWTVANGDIEGRPSKLRFRPNLRSVLGHPSLPRRLVITWTYGDDGASGLPDTVTLEALEKFEDQMEAALDPKRIAVLAFAFTHAGLREWHYYFSDMELVGAKLNEALADQPDLPIDLQACDDPDWSELAAVLESAASSGTAH